VTKEEKYIEQLKALGIWQPAFEGAVHELAVLEREQSRARKAWKETAEDGKAPSPLDPHYTLIRQQSRDIMALRDALGLTPKGLRRIWAISTQNNAKAEEPPELADNVLTLVREKHRGAG